MSRTVRRLQPSDAPDWHALLLEGARLCPTAFLQNCEEVEAIPEENREAALAAGTSWGVFEAESLIGFGAMRRQRLSRLRHRAYLGPFYVRPVAQGGGAAQELLSAMLQSARDEGVRQVDLWVAETNPRAQAFYRRAGFREVGRMPRAVVMEDGTEEADLLMVADLD